MTAGLNWADFEQTLHDGVVRAVASAVADHPGERFYAAALNHVYREEDGHITLPLLGINSLEALALEPAELRAELRWSAPDWDLHRDDWLPGNAAERWEKDLTTHACSGTAEHWQATFDRYLTTLVGVCLRARETLCEQGVTHDDFVVLLLDEEQHETLIRQVLTADEVRRHFPDLDARAAELTRITALTPAERAAYLAPLLGTSVGAVRSEDVESALRDLGPAAFPALLPLLATADRAWQAAKLLADIGRPDDAIIHALHVALERTHGTAQGWVAGALSRLGRLDLVLDRAESLPEDVLVGAVAAPYTSFRDHAGNPPPLDYRPLADFIEHRPAYLPALERHLAPGSGFSGLAAHEVDAAVAGLSSPHQIIRRHAVAVLGRRRLGQDIGRRVLPLLCRTIRQDPDPVARRLAILSLLWWRNDSRRLATVVREALADPAEEVRETATHWLREQLTDEPA
ncbi:DUF4303 domain-containing protein [Amycolatopsis sp. NPDC051716]|uniref:DUF4303 domain-containing protein n=1 Tax=Amycolatopsis sp. NPDC051716 TaxID=3155804 RepID=UPI00344939AB